MRPYLSGEHPIRFAHRGGAGLWPENTMTAFTGSYELGVRYMEIDVHVTADGVIVVFHDHVLDRLTNGTGRVDQWRWEDLRRLDNASGFQPENGFPLRGIGIGIVRLDEAVDAFPDVRWNIDMKHGAVVGPLAEFVLANELQERVMGSSFYDARLRRFRQRTGGAVATSAGPTQVAAVQLAARLGRTANITADALQIPERAGRLAVVTKRLVDTAHRSDVAVHVWTINDTESMHRLLDLGVDGIISDRPDLLVEAIEERSN